MSDKVLEKILSVGDPVEARIRFGCALAILRERRVLSAGQVADELNAHTSLGVTRDRILEIELGRFDCEADRGLIDAIVEVLGTSYEEAARYGEQIDLSTVTLSEDLERDIAMLRELQSQRRQ